MARLIDPDRFILMGAVVDWTAVRRRQIQSPRAEAIAKQRGISPRIVQLRWLVHPKDLGYPTEPFKVWRRPALHANLTKGIEPRILNSPLNYQVITWDEPQVYIQANFNVVNSNAAVYAFAGAPFTSALVGLEVLTPGFRTVKVGGPSIQCLIVSPNATLQSLVGTSPALADDKNWELMEIVGLPVGSDWAGVYDLDAPQGLTGALMSPPDAALDRYRRGAPFYGWELEMEPGLPAPPWVLADPIALRDSFAAELLDPLRQMILNYPPNQHHRFELERELLLQGTGEPATTRFFPINTLSMGAATDPLVSLISGFGTAFDDVDLPPIVLGDRKYFDDPNRSDWDYMVTARYAKGIDGNGPDVEYAAILFSPFLAGTPFAPANLRAATDGLSAPDAAEQPWRGIVRLSWDKIPDSLPFRVGSYALARAQQSPPGGVEPLMGKRYKDSALQPISATTSVQQEQETGRLEALDDTYAIASSPNPNALRYGLAHQDLFGVWSAWSVVGHSLGEPPVQKAAILSARLEVSAPASGSVCPAALVVELSWDWAVRSPQRLELVGRLYPQAKRGDPPADLSIPSGLQKSLGGLGGAFQLVFNGGNAGTPDAGGTLQYLSEDGKTILAAPLVLAGPRRYRVTISGFNLDFAATGHIGLALRARGIEHRSPNREGNWSAEPYVVSASDPRPPVLNLEYENVLLTSVADASGEHHARLNWGAAPGAVGYFVYTTTESKLRSDRGLGEPNLSQTLAERLVELRDSFGADPPACRRSFTRLNDQPITATSTQITIPRGSKEIHLYLVLGVSAGQVESAWPSLSEPLATRRKRPIAYAAPQIVPPSPPVLEVKRILDQSVSPAVYRAELRLQTRPGATVSKVELHRVRVPEAALTLDTMGPAIATITGSSAPWTVQPTVSSEPGEAQPIGRISGSDSPPGSWKPTFYRAVAWSGDDLSRGLYGGRSLPSAAQDIIVPPATPPDLSVPIYEFLSSAFTELRVNFSSPAPVDPTALGPHRLRVEVRVFKPDGAIATLYTYPNPSPAGELDDRLVAIPTAPDAAANILWREPGSGGSIFYRLRLRRDAVEDALKVRVLMLDPLGRATERVLEVPAGSPLPAPDILVPTVTPVPGRGFLFTFETSAPIDPTTFGSYRLQVNLEPDLRPIPPIPPRPIPTPIPRPIPTPFPRAAAGFDVPLSEIPLLRRGEDPWRDRAPIPARRNRTTRTTAIALYLRSTGRLTVILQAPDGRTASHRRRLS